MRVLGVLLLLILLPLHAQAFSPAIYPACEKFGPGSRLNLQTGRCECLFGYTTRHGLCMSEDDACREDYGYSAKSNSRGQCDCRSGFTFNSTGTACVPVVAVASKGPRPGRIACLSRRPCTCPAGYQVSGNIACVAK